MKFIIFLIVSIGCHFSWLLYQPAELFTVQFSQAQPAQRVAINIVNSQPAKAVAKQTTQQKVVAKQAVSTQFHSNVKRVAELAPPVEVIKKTVPTQAKPTIEKPLQEKPAPVKKPKQVTEVVKNQPVAKPAAPSSSAPVIAKQHSLQNQVIDINTLPVFKAPRPALNYPFKAKRRGYQGVAIVQIELAEDGSITDLTVLRSSGFNVLDKAALNNVSQWQFHPVMRDNQTIKARFNVPIEFSLRS